MSELYTYPVARTCRVCGGRDDYNEDGEFIYHRCRIDLDAQRGTAYDPRHAAVLDAFTTLPAGSTWSDAATAALKAIDELKK